MKDDKTVPPAQNGDRTNAIPETHLDPADLYCYTGREKSGVVFSPKEDDSVLSTTFKVIQPNKS